MSPNNRNSGKTNEVVTLTLEKCEQFHSKGVPSTKNFLGICSPKKVTVSALVGELLCDIYGKMEEKKRVSSSTCDLMWQESDRSGSSRKFLLKDVNTLKKEKLKLEKLIAEEGNQLMMQLKKKNYLLVKREAYYDMITAYIQAVSSKTKEDTKMKFSLSPSGETGFSQWLHAMKMVAQLPGGMPSEFRTKLWLQLSEKHLNDQNVDWEKAEGIIFNEWTNPDDEELGVQIVKDLHRTGCSLFCGEQEHNQALLKRVLLAYARWNKSVGYCQGFNMLAALILQVMDKNEKNAVKVMIYLIEGVLPESYFANNLQGLSVDMAVFRDLLRLRLPKLSKHLETLQHDTNSGTSYEPPLTNVFTMQWFLTLFSNCLPQQTVLRVWDLVFLYGNEVLLRTALAIWGILQDRVITVESADEFYSIMGVVTREMLEFGLMDANTLVKTIAMVDPFPNELQELREKYLYNISPWTQSVQSAARKGIKLFYGDPDDQEDTEDEDKIALTTAYGVFRRRDTTGRELQVSGPTLDIGILKQQYAKLRQRQRQAHVIITAACNSNFRGNITSGPSVSVNHLLMGKSALINKGRRIGPPEGSIPPSHYKKGNVKEAKESNFASFKETNKPNSSEDKKIDTKSNKSEETVSANGRNKSKKESEEGKVKTNHDRTEKEISENSVNQFLMKKDLRRSSESSSSSSSTSTELCDERISDSEDSSEVFEFCVRSEPLDTVQPTSTGESKISENFISFGQEQEVELNKNSDCDKNEIHKLKELANKLVDEIESDLQSSNKLESKEINLTAEMHSNSTSKISKASSAEVQNNKLDNTTEVITSLESGDLFRSDNILRLEPEVPTRGNLVDATSKNKNLEEEMQAENAYGDKKEVSEKENIQRKSDIGLSVIRENLQMLNKFSQRSTERKRDQIENEQQNNEKLNFSEKPIAKDKEDIEGVEKKIKEINFISFSEESHLNILDFKTELQEPFSPLNAFNTERITTSQKGLKTEKVNKEVNTEITFGAEEVNLYACDVRFQTKEELKRKGRREEPESPVTETGNVFRNLLYDDKDNSEIKAKIEVSKSDWMMKMKKIAELESTTREALNEMQAKSIDRKPIHEPLNLNFRRDHSKADFLRVADEEPVDAEIPVSSSFQEFSRRKDKNSELSFDAITSRTEKLLGNVEFDRLTDDPIDLSPEFEYRKPKESASKFKASSRKSSDPDHDSDFAYESLEFYSSPSSPDHRFVSKYLNDSTKHFNSKSHFAKETNSREIFSQKCSPERKRLNSNADFHSNKSTFNPFPKRIIPKPKEVGMKLGLYPTCPEGNLKKF